VSLQKWSDRIWVVSLSADPAFSEELESLVPQMLEASPHPHVVLDLSGVKHINSANLSGLLRVRKAAIDSDTQLRLAAPLDPVWAIFLTTGLDKVFEFTPDVSTALAGLSMTPDQA
jgi:anti-anti-sigma factor